MKNIGLLAKQFPLEKWHHLLKVKLKRLSWLVLVSWESQGQGNAGEKAVDVGQLPGAISS